MNEGLGSRVLKFTGTFEGVYKVFCRDRFRVAQIRGNFRGAYRQGFIWIGFRVSRN